MLPHDHRDATPSHRMPANATRRALTGRALASWSVFALALALTTTSACSSSRSEFARAVEISSLDQAIGGPTANARIGDFLLENDQIRVVIEQGGVSYHPSDVGGSIIDIDLQRPEARFRSGRGLDQLGQIAPIANMATPQAIRTPNVRITGSANGAEVTTAVDAEPVYKILLALTLLLDQRFVPQPDFRMYNEYELRPGERLLRVTTTVGFDVPFCPVGENSGCNAECNDALYDDDCACPAEVLAGCTAQGVEVIPADPLPDRPDSSILDTLLGDLPRPLGTGACLDDSECDTAAGETCVPVTSDLGGVFNVCRPPDARDGGVFFGDLLIFGGNLTPFLPGVGYDTETDIRRLFDQGEDTLAQPMELDAVYAVGDRVSLGYMAPDSNIQAPLFRGPFSLGATHAISCPTSEPGCLSGKLVRFERWVSVGTGDVASAQEPLVRAMGGSLGKVEGRVVELPSGRAMSHVDVYALADPRSLTCDAECQADASCQLPAGEVSEWTLDQLIAANRCRTREGVFIEGRAGLVSFAKTDPGTDPVLNGFYSMALAPGDYVLVALDSYRAQSRLAPVTVSSAETTRISLTLPEPGILEYAIFDEWGELSPGRITIGTCLPGEACADDSECTGGDVCQAGTCSCPWQSFVPLELGGERPHDGVLTFEETSTGLGSIVLPDGEYQLLFSRGPHYSVDRQAVIIDAKRTTQTDAALRRVVDRIGWASANFHIHTTNSMDSGEPVDHRIIGSAAEDLDFLSSSDHDWITDYEPTIEELGLTSVLDSQVGLEITTQEYGHYLAYPMDYQSWRDGTPLPSNGAIQWRGRTPQEIIEAARLQPAGDLPMIIDIPHPYDYFEYYLLDMTTLEPQDTLLSVINPMLAPTNFTGDFDAMELANSKAYSRIRRPTLEEIRFYSQGLDAIIAQLTSGQIDAAEYQRAFFNHSTEAIRQRLHRTVEEQDAFLAFGGAEVDCSCGSDGDCAAGLTCDLSLMACVDPAELSTDPPISEPGFCRKYRGVIDDWFNMLNRGVVRVGLSGSDAHGKEDGIMRTFLRTDKTQAPYLNSRRVIESVLAGRAVVSNGPMIHFNVDAAGVGDMLTGTGGQPVTLRVRVEKAHWYDVDRVEIYRNGELIHWARGCQSTRGEDDPHGHECMDTSDDAVVAWDQEIQDTPTVDSWYVVLAYGLDGRPLAPVYGTAILGSIGVPEITQRIFDIIPTLRTFRNPRYPSVHPVLPFAFTNPIWVDIDGAGWEPIWAPPPWCEPSRDFGC